MLENNLGFVSSRRSTAGALDLVARGLEVQTRERVLAQGEDWRGRLLSPPSGKR